MVEVRAPAEEDEQHLTATERAVELVEIAAVAAADKLATDIIAYDVSEQLVITDAFLLCSASNDRQVRAIVDEIEEKLRRVDAKPVRREGEREGRWVLLDYIDVVIHVQHAEERVFYALERLWKDCPQIPLPEPAIAGPPARPDAQGSAGSAGPTAR
jgi:ribosome-associated protein